jgi:hypothetical protein
MERPSPRSRPRSRCRSGPSSHPQLGHDLDGSHRICSRVAPQTGFLDQPCRQGSQLVDPLGARSGCMAELVEQHHRNVGDSGPGSLAPDRHSRLSTRLPDVAGILRRHLHHADPCRGAAPLDVERRRLAADLRCRRDMDLVRCECLADQPACGEPDLFHDGHRSIDRGPTEVDRQVGDRGRQHLHTADQALPHHADGPRLARGARIDPLRSVTTERSTGHAHIPGLAGLEARPLRRRARPATPARTVTIAAEPGRDSRIVALSPASTSTVRKGTSRVAVANLAWAALGVCPAVRHRAARHPYNIALGMARTTRCARTLSRQQHLIGTRPFGWSHAGRGLAALLLTPTGTDNAVSAGGVGARTGGVLAPARRRGS